MLDPRLGFFPPELFSSGAAVRRLQRRCPLVVVTLLPPLRLPPTFRFLDVQRARFRPSKRPSPSGLCSTPESATSCRRFRPTRAHGSPGLFRPPGFSPSSAQPGLHPISPHELLTSTSTDTTEVALPRSPPRLPRVSITEEIGLAHRWTPPKQDQLRNLPTLLNFPRLSTTHASSEPQPVRESPPRASGCIAVP
jgi:hypothetical protein